MSISSVTNPASGSGTVMSWAPKRTDTASGPRCTCAVVMTAIGRQLLAVAEQEGAGDPVGELDGVVVQQPGDQRPAVLGAGGWSGRSAEAWHHQGGTVAVVGSPVEEVPHRVAAGPAGYPVRDFLDWAADHRHSPALVVPSLGRATGPATGAEDRWALVARLLHDDAVELTDRVAGAFLRCYGQQLSADRGHDHRTGAPRSRRGVRALRCP